MELPTSSCHRALHPRYYSLVVNFSSSRGGVLQRPRGWRGCQRLSTRDWYLKPYSNSAVTRGQNSHTHLCGQKSCGRLNVLPHPHAQKQKLSDCAMERHCLLLWQHLCQRWVPHHEQVVRSGGAFDPVISSGKSLVMVLIYSIIVTITFPFAVNALIREGCVLFLADDLSNAKPISKENREGFELQVALVH